jgi:murein L,D-transpeptidase YafK
MPTRRQLLPLLAALPVAAQADSLPDSTRARAAVTRVRPALEHDLQSAGLRLGAPLFLRICKDESTLEAFLDDGRRFTHFRSFPICAWSGALGPKLREGDGQSPEGFYTVRPRQLNPASQFHLSFDLGFPNAFDRAHGRTGSYLMVHGRCVSIGCYAMTDPVIEVIWALLRAALASGQQAVPVHAFPFRMDAADAEARIAASDHADFWGQLRTGWQAFEATGLPPRISVRGRRYLVTPVSR